MVLSFRNGLFFGIGFSLVIAIFVGLGMAHSSDEDYSEMEEHHYGSHDKMMDSHHKMMSGHGCMNLCDELSDEECTSVMDKDNDGVCDICGMPMEHCLQMKEHHNWR